MCEWEELSKLGLQEYQARCLACLIENGDMTAQEVSEKSKVPYSKVYSILKELENMNLLISTKERPKRYISKTKEEIIDFFIERKRKEFERIRKQGRKAKQKLQSKKTIGSKESIYIQKTLTSEGL